jgi:hypothetical protein
MAAPEVVEFTTYDRDAVLARMALVVAAGKGWINFAPEVRDEDAAQAAPAPGIFRIFSGRGPAVPLCTWLPGERNRRGIEYASIGIQHGTGPRAAARLADRGTPVPKGWMVVSDHGKRGIVVAVEATVPDADVLDWLIRAASVLNLAEPTGTWHAVVYPGR